MFFLISTSLSRFPFVSLFLLPIHASPAIEKVRSIGAEDAGITSKSQATSDRVGNCVSDFTSVVKVLDFLVVFVIVIVCSLYDF